MSLTQAEQLFAGVHENAINDLVTAFCTRRPRHLLYGSPAFVPSTTVAATSMNAINFPGVPGGIQWLVRLSVPRIDLHPQSAPLPPELLLAPGQFSGSIEVTICLDCRRIGFDPQSNQHLSTPHPLRELTCWTVGLVFLGHIEPALTAGGADAIALVADRVEIVDIRPEELESLLECLLFMIIQGFLADMRLPMTTFAFNPFTPVAGPLIEGDQVKLRGNF